MNEVMWISFNESLMHGGSFKIINFDSIIMAGSNKAKKGKIRNQLWTTGIKKPKCRKTWRYLKNKT